MSKQRKPKIILLGPQAAGKGTQAHILATWTGSPKLVMGDLLREIQNEDSDRGRSIKELITQGRLVPDDAILELLKEWLSKQKDGWIVDGFPRTMAQAERSWEFLRPDAVLFLDLPDDEAKKRLSYRRVCAKCGMNYNLITNPPKRDREHCDICGGDLIQREDDKPETVEARLRTYHRETEPIREFYKKKGVLLEVDARPDISKVAHDIQARLDALRAESRKKGGRLKRFFLALLLVFVVLAALVFIGSLQS